MLYSAKVKGGLNMNILYTASEAIPYAASGGLADVAGSLPAAMNALGHDCRVVMPYYSQIRQELKDELSYVTNFTVPVAWRNQYCGVFTGVVNGVTYYLLDNEYYFQRNGLYGFYDDAERFIFFSRAILELLHYIDFHPNIINANDWQTALVPVYFDIFYRYQQGYEDIKTVFTIHNIQYQGQYGLELINDIMGIPLYHTDLLSYDGDVNFMKAAIETADKVTTVSPSYAWEILDPWYSHGLDRELVHKQYKLCGILNGIDKTIYDPATDKAIPKNYALNNKAGKQTCKKKLLDELGMAGGKEPVIGIVTRFVSHKGLDLPAACDTRLGRKDLRGLFQRDALPLSR